MVVRSRDGEWTLAATHKGSPMALTTEERKLVAAYRRKWRGVITAMQTDEQVLALLRFNPT